VRRLGGASRGDEVSSAAERDAARRRQHGTGHHGHRRQRLPARTLGEVVRDFPAIRQSLLASWDNCALSTLFELEGYAFTNAAQARGIIFHRYAGEVLRTLRETGEVRMPTEEAMAILYEVCAQRDVPLEDVVVVPARERRLLRIAALKLVAENEFRMDRLVAVERRLSAPVRYTAANGSTVERELTGQPDALLMDPDPDPSQSGAVVLDWKTARKAPAQGPTRHEERGQHWDDPDHVSYMGYFQQRFYGLLVLRNFPAVQRVRLREFYPLEGVARYATIYRGDLEHLEREFSALVEVLDRALASGSDGPAWTPSPGRHCSYCPAPQRCPIEGDVRVREGGITSHAEAERAAAEFVVASEVRGVLREALKAWVDVYGPVRVKAAKGRYELRFNGGRFGVHVPEVSDRGPDGRIEDAFAAAAARKRETQEAVA
jgi:hypothetical protein